MSAVLEAREPSARNLAEAPTLVREFELLATAPGGVARLRELILTMAVHGKLVAQSSNDAPAAALLAEIQARRKQLVAAGVVREGKAEPLLDADEFPFDVPPGWKWVRAADVCLVITDGDHQAPPKTDSGVPFLVIGDIRAGAVDLGSATRFVPQDYFDALDWGKKPVQGDVLYTTVGSLGIPVPVVRQQAFCFQRHIALLRPGLPEVQAYLTLALNSRLAFDQAEAGATGIAQKTVPLAVLRRLSLPLPPLAEQARIVSRVDELMRLCDALEAQGRLEAKQHARVLGTLLGTLTDSSSPEELAANWQRIADHFDVLLDRPAAVDALEQTILQLAVRGLLVPQHAHDAPARELSAKIQRLRKSKRKITPPDTDAIAEAGIELPAKWSWCSVDEVSADDETAITDGPFGANLKTEHYIESEGFRVIRLQNIGAGVFRDEHRAHVDQERYNRLRRHAAFPGDIVVAGLVDESIRCCIVPDGVGPAIVKADCYRFAVHESVNARYICLYLCSQIAHQFASAHHHGLTLTRIGLGNFRSIPVPLPPAGEQRRIVARVDELLRVCAELRQRLDRGSATQAALGDALIDQALSA